jgi:4-amino-4-deoxy-L-arabinose transferase-like glycosyltransferase
MSEGQRPTPDNASAPPQRSSRRSRILLTAVVGIYLLLGGVYAVVFPLGHAPDEPAHFAYVLFIAENGRLPDYHADDVGYESYQAPLYYTLSAGVCKLTMMAAEAAGGGLTADAPAALDRALTEGELPPQIDKHPWVPRAQYMLMFASWKQALQYSPAQRAGWLAVRLFTVVLGGLAVVLGWWIMRVLFPRREWLANTVAVGMAFLPMYTHICAAVGNDPPTVVIVELSVLLTLLMLRDGPTPRRVGLLGVSLGLGMLVKDSANVVIPVALLALAWSAGRRYEPEPHESFLADLARRIVALRWGLILKRGALMLGAIAAVAGWWFARNALLYGEVLHYPANPQTQLPWDYYLIFPSHLWLAVSLHVPMTFRNFWGNFAWTNIALPMWMYWAFMAISLLPVPGLVLLSADARAGRIEWTPQRRRAFAVVLLTLALMAAAVTGHALFIGIGGGSQGRYYFPVLFALSLLWTLGVARLLQRDARPQLQWAVGAAMLAFNLWCLLALIIPFYRALGS